MTSSIVLIPISSPHQHGNWQLAFVVINSAYLSPRSLGWSFGSGVSDGRGNPALVAASVGMVVVVGIDVAVCVGWGVAEGNLVGVIDGDGALASGLGSKAGVTLFDSGCPAANPSASSPVDCPGKQPTNMDNKTTINTMPYFTLYARNCSIFIFKFLIAPLPVKSSPTYADS